MLSLTRTATGAATTSCAFFLAVAAFADDVSGTFEGRSNHLTKGAVTVVEAQNGAFIRLGEDFSLDGAPDPVVGLGRDGEFAPATTAGSLRQLTGAQDYLLPEGTEIGDFNEVHIWCERFAVPLGVAALD